MLINPDLISFCIPTYNGCQYLKQTLPQLIKIIRPFGFKIIISDNASTDDTFNTVKEFILSYNNISYVKQEINIGADKNFEFVLKASDSKYAILIGDTYTILEKEFNGLVNILATEKYKIVFVNFSDRIKGIDSREYNCSSTVINDIGWHITFMSSSIFSRDLIQNANFKRYYRSNFIQHGIVIEYIENTNALCYWYAKNCIDNIPKHSGWYSSVISVFGKDWTEYVLSLPRSIPLAIKIKCIKEHGIKTNVFSLRSLANYREIGYISKQNYKDFKIYFPFFMTKRTIFLFRLIVFLPKPIFTSVRRILGRKGLH